MALEELKGLRFFRVDFGKPGYSSSYVNECKKVVDRLQTWQFNYIINSRINVFIRLIVKDYDMRL